MILFQIKKYDGRVVLERPLTTTEALDAALAEMRGLARAWEAEGGNLDTARIVSLSAPEDDEDPDQVAAYVDEDRRDPIVVVGGRLADARAMLCPH